MKFTLKLLLLILFNLSFLQNSFSDNHNIYETLEIIKSDLKTLERAVYSGSIEIKTSSNDQSNIECIRPFPLHSSQIYFILFIIYVI